MKVFVPGHITSIFYPIRKNNLLKTGSRGAGVSISHGYEVTGETIDENRIKIFQNGEEVGKDESKISYEVAKEFLEDIGSGIKVEQEFQIPHGSGYGASGAGALGTALCLGKICGKTMHEAGKIAHRKEVQLEGGLGDVYPQLVGGVEIRRREGGPGYGWVDNIIADEEWKIVSASFGNLDTSDIIGDKDQSEELKKVATERIDRIVSNPNIKSLMNNSREFSNEMGFLDDFILDLLLELDEVMSIPPSMIMLGKSVFGFVQEDEIQDVKSVLERYDPIFGPIESRIDFRGARFLK